MRVHHSAVRSFTTSPQLARRRTLRLLLRAHRDAEDSGTPAQEFAVAVGDFQVAGVLMSDLRWLVRRQYVEHLVEVLSREARQRKFRKTSSLAFSGKSCFVLTASGLEFAASRVIPVRPTIRAMTMPAVERVPRWDAKSRELWLGDVLVRRFRTKAINQERVLAAFQEERWPVQIDDPLPPHAETERERRLHDAITKLNRHQCNSLLHFRGDGSGNGVCWEVVSPAGNPNR